MKLSDKISRHLGVGNATGLGMAPFIIKHPKLVHKWMSQFYKTIEDIKSKKKINNLKLKKFINLLKKSQKYLNEVLTNDKFKKHYPNWKQKYNTRKIISELMENL